MQFPQLPLLMATMLVSLMASHAHANNFPFSAGGLRWSATRPPPKDESGKSRSGFTNGCVRIKNGQAVIAENTLRPIIDNRMCGVNRNGLVEIRRSEAALACRKIGGRLPTKEEFERIISSVNPSGLEADLSLTEAQKLTLKSNLGEDITSRNFWTSSVLPNNPFGANIFLGKVGKISDSNRYLSDFSLRCVSN